MGRLLETLRRRDSARAQPEGTPCPPIEAPEPLAKPVEVTPPRELAEAVEMPFIEVPEETSARPVSIPIATPAAERNGAAEAMTVTFVEAAPLPPLPQSNVSRELCVWHESTSAAASHYRQVSAGLRSLLAAEKAWKLLFLPLERRSSAAPAAVNLALALAESEPRLLLIDGDSHGRRVAEMLGSATAPGWTDVVHGLPLPQAIQETGWKRLHLLGAGNRLAGALSPLEGDKMRGILHALKSHYDLVLMYGSPWSAGGVSAVLPHLCDAVCLLLEKQEVDQLAETRCLEALQSQGIRVIGSVVLGS